MEYVLSEKFNLKKCGIYVMKLVNKKYVVRIIFIEERLTR